MVRNFSEFTGQYNASGEPSQDITVPAKNIWPAYKQRDTL